MTILEEKDRLRAAVLAKRLRMTATEKQKKDEILAEKLCSQPVFQQCQSIYVFLSKKNRSGYGSHSAPLPGRGQETLR